MRTRKGLDSTDDIEEYPSQSLENMVEGLCFMAMTELVMEMVYAGSMADTTYPSMTKRCMQTQVRHAISLKTEREHMTLKKSNKMLLR